MQLIDMTSPSARVILAEINAGTFDIDPRDQRGLVWSIEDKRKLISFIIETNTLPGTIVRKTTQHSDLSSVLDGKQRLTALKDFVENKYTITVAKEAGGSRKAYFNNLNSETQSKIMRAKVPQLTFEFYSEQESMDYFIGLNTRGKRANGFDLLYAKRNLYPSIRAVEKMGHSGKYVWNKEHGVLSNTKTLVDLVCFSKAFSGSPPTYYKVFHTYAIADIEAVIEKALYIRHKFFADVDLKWVQTALFKQLAVYLSKKSITSANEAIVHKTIKEFIRLREVQKGNVIRRKPLDGAFISEVFDPIFK